MAIEMNDYQRDALSTAIYPGRHTLVGLFYATIKLNGEAGEFSEKVGKFLRDDIDPKKLGLLHDPSRATIPLEKREQMVRELGDCLWYISALADELGYTMEQVALMNLIKLRQRQRAGTLGGTGDER